MTAEACGPSFSQDTEQNTTKHISRSLPIMHSAILDRKPFSYSYIKNAVPERTNYAYGFNTGVTASVNDLAGIICTAIWGASIWANGHRRQENFLFSDLVALDFDSPEFSLEQAKKTFCDMRHIIGTTRNHQKAKNNLPPCDRFRVVLFWDKRILDLRTFRFNMQAYADKYPLDENALDGARYFFPCNTIASISDEGFAADVAECPKGFEPVISPEEYREILSNKMRSYQISRRFDRHIEDFLYRGKPFWSGRQASCYSSAIAMLESGLSREEVIALLKKAPFDRKDFDVEKDLVHAVDRAEKFIVGRIYGPGKGRARSWGDRTSGNKS